MSKEKFNEIIDFAIEREKDAVIFYNELQKDSSFAPNKEYYAKLETMEQGHVNALEEIKNDIRQRENLIIPEVENLHISDYLVEPSSEGKLSYQDIIILAMKREEKAYDLYTKLAEESKDDHIKKLFLKLAGEEAKHKNHFEKIYDKEVLLEN